MPAVRVHLEATLGYLSHATWQRIDAAGGLISTAAAQAAERMKQSLLSVEQGEPTSALRAKVNQWRVAQHCAELMRSMSMSRVPADQAVSASPAVEATATPRSSSSTATHTGAAEGPAYRMSQEVGDVTVYVNGAMTHGLENASGARQSLPVGSGEGLGMASRDDAEDRARQDRPADQNMDLGWTRIDLGQEQSPGRRRQLMSPSGGAGASQQNNTGDLGDHRDQGLGGPEPEGMTVLHSREGHGVAHNDALGPPTEDIPCGQNETTLPATGPTPSNGLADAGSNDGRARREDVRLMSPNEMSDEDREYVERDNVSERYDLNQPPQGPDIQVVQRGSARSDRRRRWPC